MKLLIMSDLHLEFEDVVIPQLENEDEIVLILAGDICELKNKHLYNPFMQMCSERFRKTLVIAGNHEFYGGDLDTAFDSIDSYPYTVHFMENDTVIIDGIAFIAATLWGKVYGDPNEWFVRRALADYSCIQKGSRAATPLDTTLLFEESSFYIFNEIPKHKRAVVITHHLPSYKSVHPMYLNSNLNAGFATNLDKEITESKPELWIHGHTHSNCDYMLGDTRIVCNPKGYTNENPNFKINYIVEI